MATRKHCRVLRYNCVFFAYWKFHLQDCEITHFLTVPQPIPETVQNTAVHTSHITSDSFKEQDRSLGKLTGMSATYVSIVVQPYVSL